MNGLLFIAVSLLAVYGCLRTPKILERSAVAKCDTDLPQCESFTCIFKKSGWMNGDQIDKSSLTAHFDEFASEYPEWQTAVHRVKAECIEKNLLPQSIHLNCPAFDIMHCTYGTLIKNAQESLWSKKESCVEPRRFVATCVVCPKDCLKPRIPIGSCNACINWRG